MNAISTYLQKIDIRLLVLILAITETLHNLEEAIWLPAWSSKLPIWRPVIGELEFRIAIVLLTLMLYWVMYYFVSTENKFSRYMFSGVVVIILFNVFAPHLLGSIITGELMPGVVTGVLLNLPITVLLLWKGLQEKRISWRTIVIGGVAFGLLTIPLLLMAFAIGSIIRQWVF